MFVKSVWYLPAALFVSFVLYGLIGLWYSEWVAVGYEGQREGGIYGILEAGTVDAIQRDERLHDALLSLTAMVASKSEVLGEQVGSDSLKEFGQSLTVELAKLKKVRPQRRKRGLLEDLGNLITGRNQQAQGQDGGALASLGDALGLGDGNSTGGLGSLLQQGLSSIGDSIIGGLATPALFLGIGIGMGTDTGLNLTDTQNSQAIASKVAVAFNAQPTGINQVAQNLGTGLSAQLAPSLGNISTGAQLGMTAFALAQGIGQGSATGLKLTQQQIQPSNGTDVMSIAGNFGLGLSQPIASTINIQQLFSGAGASGMAQLPQIAAAAGKGFGEGASAGLGLSKNTTSLQRRQSADPNAVDIPGTVGDFSRGLSQSFLQTSDLNKLAPGASGLGNIDIMGMLLPIASGAGKGIGEGAAIGFGFQADAGLAVMPANANSNQSTELVVSEFAKGLVASFLANGTATVALSNLTAGAGGLTSSVQASKVAEGLARGLVEGSVNAISMVGGINNVLSGNFSVTAAMNIPEMAPSAFNDSVNGSAIAFGRGLAGEGTLLIANLITNMTKKAPQKRSIAAIESRVVTSKALSTRQSTPPPSSPALAISSDMLSSLAQAGTNALTCQGFGGIAAIALGLKNSGTIKLDSKSSVPLDNQTLAALPKDPITITSEGNRFTIKIQNGEIRINDLALVPFAVLTALHVLFTTFAFFYALPTYLALGAILRLSVMIGYPLNEEKIKKWRRLILLVAFLPSALFGTVFGIVGIGKAGHFRDAHGIVGLLTFLLIIPTVVTTVLRLRSKAIVPSSAFAGFKAIPRTFNSPARIHLVAALLQQVILQFATLTWIQGFSTLRSISLCIVDAILTAPVVVGLMTAILFTQVGAMSIVGLRMWLEQRIVKKSALSQGEGGIEKGAVNRSDTMKTFGFNERELPTLPSISPTPPSIRPELKERNTRELLGREDSKIGWPSQVRKFGDDETIDPRRDDDNPFLALGEQSQDRFYDEKLGGFVLSPTRQSQYAAYRPGQQQPSPTRPSYESQSTYPDFAYERDRPGRQSAPRKSLAAGVQRKPVSGGVEEERGDSAVLPQRYESFSRLRKERASGPEEEEIRVGWPSFVARREEQR